MKKYFSLFALIPLICLSSCNKTPFSYGDTIDPKKDYILSRTEETEHATDKEGKFKHFPHQDNNVNNLLYRVTKGESVLFTFLSDDCSHCSIAAETFSKTINRLGIDNTAFINRTSVVASVINNYVTENNIVRRLGDHVFNGATPSMYLLNNKYLTEVTYGSFGEEKDNKAIITCLKEYTTASNVYVYTSYEKYLLSLKNDELGVIYSLSDLSEADFYYENVYCNALRSGKTIRVIDSFLAKISEQSIITLGKEKASLLSQEGMNLIGSYFGD